MMLVPTKVCPVVLRRRSGRIDILAFEHPTAGRQLVKGGIERGESVETAALRELAEESGIASARVERVLGVWASGHEDQVWAFVTCTPDAELPDAWTHDAPDDGGKAFRFFWHPLDESASETHWHLVFRDALRFIQSAL